MASGKLSFELDDDGNKTIEASELVRVYGDACKFDREEKRGQTTETKRSEAEPDSSIAAMKAMQERLTGQYVAQIDHLQLALEKAQDGQNRVTLLLEQRSSDTTAWQASLDAMSEKIANQTEKQISVLQERHDSELSKLKRALYKERNKSFWQKLFG
ncbi:MAG: hypothetical protein GXP26_13290 [Planctomycetes bacterium]|nr:hypothetical protein [Planctomycetota bacterium]